MLPECFLSFVWAASHKLSLKIAAMLFIFFFDLILVGCLLSHRDEVIARKERSLNTKHINRVETAIV